MNRNIVLDISLIAWLVASSIVIFFSLSVLKIDYHNQINVHRLYKQMQLEKRSIISSFFFVYFFKLWWSIEQVAKKNSERERVKCKSKYLHEHENQYDEKKNDFFFQNTRRKSCSILITHTYIFWLHIWNSVTLFILCYFFFFWTVEVLFRFVGFGFDLIIYKSHLFLLVSLSLFKLPSYSYDHTKTSDLFLVVYIQFFFVRSWH